MSLRRSPLKASPPINHSQEPGYRAWHEPVFGRCGVCGHPGLLLRHHVILERHVREAGGDPYDLRNSLLIGAGYSCTCHRDHHRAVRRLPCSALPPAAIEFAVELLGAERADAYFDRYYR